jgi:hypothetical protein
VSANPNDSGTFGTTIDIGSAVVTNASVQFIDRSLQPNVHIALEQINATVLGLSSEGGGRASFQARGLVEKSAVVEVTGKINPWSQKQPMDVKLALKKMDVVPASPYAGKFLGYQLKNGILSADLDYQLAEGKLKSQNIITLDRFDLGEKVASQAATALPVRMAVSILKDRNGKMVLSIPVDGNLRDPQYHFLQAISRTILTEISKIATSPFDMLGNLFGGNGE